MFYLKWDIVFRINMFMIFSAFEVQKLSDKKYLKLCQFFRNKIIATPRKNSIFVLCTVV